MKYLLDTHFLSNDIFKLALRRGDLYILEDVLREHTSSDEEMRRIMASGIKVITLTAEHFKKLEEVMEKHGDNFDLIRLFTAEGTADVLMLAFVLSESLKKDEMFPVEWTIITKDNGLLDAAKGYGINCSSKL